MQTIFLEFQHENGALAANGSDVIFYIDGRWSKQTADEKIQERVSALREGARGTAYAKQLFVGVVYSGHDRLYPRKDHNPPEWAVKTGQA